METAEYRDSQEISYTPISSVENVGSPATYPSYFKLATTTTDPITFTSVIVNKLPSEAISVEPYELKIITYENDQEMMLKNIDKNQLASWDRPENYQLIQKVTPENDPRRVTARLLNYVVGVTGEGPEGEGPVLPSQVQIWF
jgi:hypothetical protein